MSRSVAVVGAARSGKTLFCISFAEYLGARILNYSEESGAGRGSSGALSPAAARELMVDRGRRGGGAVRTFAVHLLQPACRRIALIDTISLKDKSALSRPERSRLLLTLRAMQGADVILQMIDLSCRDPVRLEFDEEVGRSLAVYCRGQGKMFLMVGSKVDLLQAPSPRECFTPSGKMIFISSVTRAGFPELGSDILGLASSRG